MKRGGKKTLTEDNKKEGTEDQVSHVCHRFESGLFLCYHKSIVACTSQLRLVAGHVALSKSTFCYIQYD
jgi:hypothetical protein